jgi:hypothetical protein
VKAKSELQGLAYLSESSGFSEGSAIIVRILIVFDAIAIASDNDNTKDFRHLEKRVLWSTERCGCCLIHSASPKVIKGLSTDDQDDVLLWCVFQKQSFRFSGLLIVKDTLWVYGVSCMYVPQNPADALYKEDFIELSVGSGVLQC